MTTPGRNDPCPCGSGRKYKACCAARAAEATPLRSAHASEAGAIAAQFSPLQQVIQLQRRPPAASAPIPAAALHRRAMPLLKSGKSAEALPLLRRADRLAGENPAILHDLGVACLNCQLVAEAIGALRRSIARRPDFAQAHYDLGRAHELEGSDHTAIVAYRRAVALAPKLAAAHARLGELLLRGGAAADAAEAFRHAAATAEDTTFGRYHRARALLALQRTAEAEALLRRAIALDPASRDAHRALGTLLAEDGRFDDAISHLDRAIALAPQEVVAYHSIALSKKFGEAERPLLARMLARLQAGGLADRFRMMLHFAAGKALDDLRDHAGAMRHFEAANRIRRRLSPPFSRQGLTLRVNEAIARFTTEFFAAHAGLGAADETPVFIVGMPRSGTTLTEQIFSSHPSVAGGGELTYWSDDTARLLSDPARLADGYLQVLRGIAPAAARVTDKQPFNLFWLGSIHMAFPRARIIHCRRNPIDTCLSIYCNHFAGVWDFAADFGDLAFFYPEYLRLMAHWRAVLPADRLLDVDYEALTADPETVTRRLIAFCGLDWNDVCLRPEQNRRAVKTASLWQARQPVYRDSVERWRNYEPWIGELQTLLPAVSENFTSIPR